MSPSKPKQLLRRPLQERSRRTLERVLDATEELLELRPFEDIAVSAIVKAAGTSVGAFYSRFRDKEALLPVLYERYGKRVGERAARHREERPWEGLDLEGVIRWLVSELAQFFQERKFLMRAVTLHARTRPDKIGEEARSTRDQQMSFLREAVLGCRAEIGHPEPERAVDFAIFMAASACRELILFADAPHAALLATQHAELAEEVVRQMLAYLKFATPTGEAPTRSSRTSPTL